MENVGVANWNILRPFGIVLYGNMVNLVAIWNIFPVFGMFCQEKSGKPG
jgi:hypothetical protein